MAGLFGDIILVPRRRENVLFILHQPTMFMATGLESGSTLLFGVFQVFRMADYQSALDLLSKSSCTPGAGVTAEAAWRGLPVAQSESVDLASATFPCARS